MYSDQMTIRDERRHFWRRSGLPVLFIGLGFALGAFSARSTASADRQQRSIARDMLTVEGERMYAQDHLHDRIEAGPVDPWSRQMRLVVRGGVVIACSRGENGRWDQGLVDDLFVVYPPMLFEDVRGVMGGGAQEIAE